tara:strand:- start:58 stop:837 length:780 start_codon:yes stop_codon:yes gene_type:complete
MKYLIKYSNEIKVGGVDTSLQNINGGRVGPGRGTSSFQKKKNYERKKEFEKIHGKPYVKPQPRLSSPTKPTTPTTPVDPNVPQTGFFSRAFTTLKKATGTLDKTELVTDSYIDLVRSKLVIINNGKILNIHQLNAYKNMTIAELDKYIDDNLTVSDEDIKLNLKRLVVVNRGALSEKDINLIKNIKLKDFEQFIVNNMPVTDTEIQDNLSDLEYIVGHSPLTNDDILQIKQSTHEAFNLMIQNKEQSKINLANAIIKQK